MQKKKDEGHGFQQSASDSSPMNPSFTPTPSFPMENKKENKEGFPDGQKDAVSTGNASNPMRVENSQIIKAVQPHNARLYFDFEKVGYNPTPPRVLKNHGSEEHYDYPTHRIVVRKKTIEVCYLAHQKQWHRLVAESEKEIDDKLKELDKEIDDKCYLYLKEFIAKHGGKTQFNLLRKRKQDWGIHGDDFLDNIPDDMIINADSVKKWYRDKVEFLGVNETSNYLKNRALENYSPIIAEKLESLNKEIKAQKVEIQSLYPLKKLKDSCKSINDIIANKELVLRLSVTEKRDFERWIFEKFGVMGSG